MREERKLVTVVFADIVGSSALGEAHDPEVIRATLARAFRALSEVLQTHGGTVEKFIGDAVMAVFGIPAAHDDDAERAVRSAFKLQDRLRQLNATARLQLELRIGIDTGEAVAGKGKSGENLVTGSVVNGAARLQTAAAPGEILVGTLTHRLTRDAVAYAEARQVQAKGIGGIDGWPAKEIASAVPESRHGVPGLRAPLIGRDGELRRLQDEYERLRGVQRARLITIYGPAGAGKSRLANEFIASIPADRVRVGRCLPYGEGITYYAIQLIVRADAGIEPGDALQTAMYKLRRATLAEFPDAEDADAVARRVAVLAGFARADEALVDVAPNDLREELRWGLRRYFERRARRSPFVLVFEDIHWGEPGLIDVIANLAEWSRAPILLLCLARPEFRVSAPSWGRDPAIALSLALAPLSDDDTRRLVEALLPSSELPEALRDELVSRAEGNPLFVEEFLRMLIETGRMEVPPTLLGLITARLDTVSPELKYLLQRGSLPGRNFSTAALAALGTGSDPDPAVLGEALRRDLLVEVDDRAQGSGQVFRFKHALIRDVAYSTVSKSDRAILHDRYGRWLEERFGDRRNEVIEIIAHHAEQSYRFAREVDLGDSAALGRRALELLRAAASKAFDRDDAHAALNLYERAEAVAAQVRTPASELAEVRGYSVVLRRHLSPERRPVAELDQAIEDARSAGPSAVLVDLLLARAFESHRFGERGMRFADEALVVARALPDAELVGEAMWTQLELMSVEGKLAEMQSVLVEAVAHLRATGARRARARILLWGSRLARYRGDFTEAAIYRDELVGDRGGSKADRGIAALVDCRFTREVGDVTGAVMHGREALALMREVGLPHWTGLCCLHLGDALLESGDPAAAKSVFLEGLEIFVRRGQPRQIPELAARAARACVRLGDATSARAYAEMAQSLALPDDQESGCIAAVALGEAREAEGDVPGADESFRRALTLLEGTPFLGTRAFAREAFAEFLVRHGRIAEARAELDAARDFHQDALTFRNRDRIERLLARTQVTA